MFSLDFDSPFVISTEVSLVVVLCFYRKVFLRHEIEVVLHQPKSRRADIEISRGQRALTRERRPLQRRTSKEHFFML